MKEKGIDFLLAVANICLVGLLVWMWFGKPIVLPSKQPEKLPPEVVILTETESVKEAPKSATGTQKSAQRLQEINLAVPFTVQAPRGNWDLPFQEACEEASVAMAVGFVNKETAGTWSAEDGEKKILDIVNWQQEHFGFYEDTTVEQTNEILVKKFNITTGRIIHNPQADDLRAALAGGSIILAPFYGRALPNPHFRGEGPLYHMLVIKGFTDDGFITNDPGTKFGRNFFYTDKALLGALHDWNGGDVENGQKVVLVVSR